jgi:hypothetical protein
MRLRVFPIWLALVVVSFAQEQKATLYNGHGYGQFGVSAQPGGFANLISLSGGAEGFVYKGIPVGVELAAVGTNVGFGDSPAGLLSINSGYHFTNRRREKSVVPYLTGGYTLGFGDGGVASFVNAGGGVTWWFSQRVGLRTEVRVYQLAHSCGDCRVTMCSFGVAIR